MLHRSAVGQLSSLSSRTKWQRLPKVVYHLPADPAILFYWIRMKVVQQLTCLTLGCPNGPAYSTGELLNTLPLPCLACLVDVRWRVCELSCSQNDRKTERSHYSASLGGVTILMLPSCHLLLACLAVTCVFGISWRCLMLIKPEWLGYRVVKKLWQYVKPFSLNTRTWRTDGRTDRIPISTSHVSMLTHDINCCLCTFPQLTERPQKIWWRLTLSDVLRSFHIL